MTQDTGDKMRGLMGHLKAIVMHADHAMLALDHDQVDKAEWHVQQLEKEASDAHKVVEEDHALRE